VVIADDSGFDASGVEDLVISLSPVVNPRAISDNTISSMSSRRRCRLRTICGSKPPSRVRGTSTSTGPISVRTVLVRCPLREVPSLRPAGSCLSYAQVLAHFRVQRGLKHRLGQPARQARLGVSEPVTPF
jgi:hypothetical protein